MLRLFLPLLVTLAALIGSGEMIHACVDNDTGLCELSVKARPATDNERALNWGVVGLQAHRVIRAPPVHRVRRATRVQLVRRARKVTQAPPVHRVRRATRVQLVRRARKVTQARLVRMGSPGTPRSSAS